MQRDRKAKKILKTQTKKRGRRAKRRGQEEKTKKHIQQRNGEKEGGKIVAINGKVWGGWV